MKTQGIQRAPRLACLALAVLASLPLAAQANGGSFTFAPGKYFIKSGLASIYIDPVNGASAAGTLTNLRGKLNMSREVWEVVPAGGGWFYIKSELGRYLEVKGGSAAVGTRTQLADFTGDDRQRWAIEYEAAGPRWTVRSHVGTFLSALGGATASGTPTAMADGGRRTDQPPEQEWVFESAGTGFPLAGFVDMHTHPMSHLAFGGKLIHGAPDIQTLMPAFKSGNDCVKYDRPWVVDDALSTDNPTHGGVGIDNLCGDSLREIIVGELENELGAAHHHHSDGARGYPWFVGWPAYNDITHQTMWIDWIRRAHEGGLKVMVALAVNNETLAAAVMGPGDINGDDKKSADVQIQEMKDMALRHGDFMQIAYTPAQLRDIVRSGKLAVVLGMEVDNIGNFHDDGTIVKTGGTASETKVHAELQRLWDKGVRYQFPIHLIDNKFGGTALYEDFFNLSNFHINGTWWDLVCAGTDIKHRFVKNGFDAALAAARAVKLGIDPFDEPPAPPVCASGVGHRNAKDLSTLGEFAVKDMMKFGMLIDVDHMSAFAVDDVLDLAETFGYPVNSGHNGLREGAQASENDRSIDVYKRIVDVGGMIGLGHTGSATSFQQMYAKVLDAMKLKVIDPDRIGIGLGTDVNGLWPLPGPPTSASAKIGPSPYTFGFRTWNYDSHGVAHYGLIGDFVTSFSQLMTPEQSGNFQRSADDFATMWENAERARINVQ
ncbi:membrane dipeptidase [Tahibacter soli]|uniref:Membrane dipeptidase n=1 Tax=Tahibacter soli TaxID=2983605 RepID=A0A9X4BKX8_9GAMM|nr:membrane dipeptidase [Tahibacter soli]MDC8016168.1 membrane dipeptidase [Tahibacter soli]